jgi:Ca2+-binding RTX toxin-like protein
MPIYAGTKDFTYADTYADPVYAGWFIEGTAGSETLYGSQYDDEIWALGGNDIIYDQGGNDRIFAGDGNDTIIGSAGRDRLDGGDGSDTVSYAASAAVIVDLSSGRSGQGGYASGDTYISIENVLGSAYADTLLGNASDNVLSGGAGNDYIDGYASYDTLDGGDGNDTLIGGHGNDRLTGGAGNDVLWGDLAGGGGLLGVDTFHIALSGGGVDTIGDFQHGYDHIVISGFGYDAHEGLGSDGKLAVGYFRTDGTWIGTGLGSGDELIYLTDRDALCRIDDLTGSSITGKYSIETTTLVITSTTLATDDLFLAY